MGGCAVEGRREGEGGRLVPDGATDVLTAAALLCRQTESSALGLSVLPPPSPPPPPPLCSSAPSFFLILVLF